MCGLARERAAAAAAAGKTCTVVLLHVYLDGEKHVRAVAAMDAWRTPFWRCWTPPQAKGRKGSRWSSPTSGPPQRPTLGAGGRGVGARALGGALLGHAHGGLPQLRRRVRRHGAHPRQGCDKRRRRRVAPEGSGSVGAPPPRRWRRSCRSAGTDAALQRVHGPTGAELCAGEDGSALAGDPRRPRRRNVRGADAGAREFPIKRHRAAPSRWCTRPPWPRCWTACRTSRPTWCSRRQAARASWPSSCSLTSAATKMQAVGSQHPWDMRRINSFHGGCDRCCFSLESIGKRGVGAGKFETHQRPVVGGESDEREQAEGNRG